MNAQGLISQFESLGAQLKRNGERIEVEAPAGVVSAKLLQELRRHKAEVLALLSERATASFERQEGYEYPKFTIPTPVGHYEFLVEIPKAKYDPFLIWELFERYQGAVH